MSVSRPAAVPCGPGSTRPLLLLLMMLLLVPPPPPPMASATETDDRSSCPQCLQVADKQQAARLKVEAIKKQILSKLSLQERPNITAQPPPRQVVLEMLKQVPPTNNIPAQSVGEDSDPHRHHHHHHHHPPQQHQQESDETKDDYYARTSEIIAFAEPGSSLNGHVLLDFHQTRPNPSPSGQHQHHGHPNQRLRVTGATLWIQLRHVTPPSSLSRRIQTQLWNHTVTLYVFNATASNASNATSDGKFDLVLVGSHRCSAMQLGWKKINLSEAVHDWFAQARSRLTLLVDCNGCDSYVELSLFPDPVSPSQHLRHRGHDHRRAQERDETEEDGGEEAPALDVRPFLSIATETTRRRRSRRHALTCNGQTSRCCKQPLYINFRDLGWDDWIIAPKGYYANYCVGDCARHPRTPDTFATFHTQVLEYYRSLNPYASIAPCCAPTRLSSMSLIYLDTHMNIFKTDLPKMIVEECGCT